MILHRFALYLTVNLLYIWPFMTVITIRISLKKMFAKKLPSYEGGGGERERYKNIMPGQNLNIKDQ